MKLLNTMTNEIFLPNFTEISFANHKREANSCGGGGICLTLSVCTPGSTDEEGEFIPVEGSCPSSNLVCCVYVPFNEKR